MKLSTYIDLYYDGNKSKFARAMDVRGPQVHAWIKADSQVINGELITSSRTLPALPGTPVGEENKAFEAIVSALNGRIPLTVADGRYTDPWVRGAFKMFQLLGESQGKGEKHHYADLIKLLESIETLTLNARELASDSYRIESTDSDGYF